MSIFSQPKVPKPAKPPLQSEPITLGSDQNADLGLNMPGARGVGSLISTSAQGLRRKAPVRKPSLISGGTNASS